jgi:hypothetical protein
MKKLLFSILVFVSTNGFSQKISKSDRDYAFTEIYQLSKVNIDKSNKKDYDYAKRAARRERIIGGTIFGTAFVFFVGGLISTYKLNRN